MTDQIDFQDVLIHGTAAEQTVRCVAAVTTNLVREAAARHATAPTATAAFGRLLTAAALLGATYKDFDRLTLRIESNGVIEGVVAEANSHGGVRGYVKNPDADTDFRADGKYNVGAIVGDGMFHITREAGYAIGLFQEPYKSSVPLVSGEIGEDLAYYLAKSEQIPSGVLLGVSINQARREVLASGGIILQMMPGATDATIGEIEAAIAAAPSVTEMILAGATPPDLLKAVLGAIDYEVLAEKKIGFECTCSAERFVSILSSLARTELKSMIDEDHGATLVCHFCNSNYTVDEPQLQAIYDKTN